MIEATSLTKRYGATTAVDDVTFAVHPGRVTGFLGPNGAGKSTTMRLVVGLDRPTGGTVTINGAQYADLRAPLREVGVLLDAKAVHPGRSARAHLRAIAATHGIPKRRVEEVIALTGLESVADKRVRGFSLGMGQRLGIAAALIGDPGILILDEPVNGLDPEGVIWVRKLARHLAQEGRTVFLSSHLMSEMAQTADHIIVLGRGRVIADAPVASIVALATGTAVRLRTPHASRFTPVLAANGATVTGDELGLLEVNGITSERIGELAAQEGVVLHELSPVAGSLEDAYLTLTQDEVVYHAGRERCRMSAPNAVAASAAGSLSGVSFGGVLRSEWIKLVSLRSTVWCYAILVALTIGLGLIVAASLGDAEELGVTTPDATQSTWVLVSTLGINFGQLVIAVLGALVITGEYDPG